MRLYLSEIQGIADGEEATTVTLSPLSLALLTSLVGGDAAEIFYWSDLSLPDRDIADDLVAKAAYELMHPVVTSMKYALIREQYASGSNAGGTVSSASWQYRTLNSMPYNTIAGLSMAGSALDMPTGNYLLSVNAPFIVSATTGKKIELGWQRSDNAILARSAVWHANVASVGLIVPFETILQLTQPATINLVYRINDTRANDGLGRANSVAGQNEIYTTVRVLQL